MGRPAYAGSLKFEISSKSPIFSEKPELCKRSNDSFTIPAMPFKFSCLVFETGRAYWLLEDPPGQLHGDINDSDEPIEVMVIEFKTQ